MMKKLGLDFGTTNSAIAIEEDGIGKVLEVDGAAIDPRVVRSMLYFERRELVYRANIPPSRIKMQVFMPGDIDYIGNQRVLIGQSAVSKYLEENKNRTAGVKRRFYTGRWIRMKDNPDQPKTDAVREFYDEIDYGTGRLMQALKTALKSPGYTGTTAFGKFYTLEELISIFVGEIKKKAGGEFSEVVCGRPVKFSDDPERDKAAQDRLEEGLKLAGFEKISFIYEPVAAAKQFVAHRRIRGSEKSEDQSPHPDPLPEGEGIRQKEEVVLVFDFGGGTLDTAIVRGDEVLASDGVYIGGDLLNGDILRAKLWSYFGADNLWGDQGLAMPYHIYEGLQSWFNIPNMNNPDTMQLLQRLKYKNTNVGAVGKLEYLIKTNLGFDLYEAIEKAKKELSMENEAMINFSDGPIEIHHAISREEFEKIILARVEEIREVVFRTLKSAKLEAREVDVVVRTGGSSLIPIFEMMLVDIFGGEKIQQFETFTSIAAGLALD